MKLYEQEKSDYKRHWSPSCGGAMGIYVAHDTGS